MQIYIGTILRHVHAISYFTDIYRYVRVSMSSGVIFTCRRSISGRSELGILSREGRNKNDEIRYRLRSRHASRGEAIFRRVDEQFSIEMKCSKKRYGNSLCISKYFGTSKYSFRCQSWHIILIMFLNTIIIMGKISIKNLMDHFWSSFITKQTVNVIVKIYNNEK